MQPEQEEGREDDNLSVIKTRYSTYIETTKPVSDHYMEKQSKIYHQINGEDQIDEITSKIKKILQKS